MDDLDRAQQIEELHRAQAISKMRSAAEEPEYDDDGNRICLDCGIIIPIQRVNAVNAVRCVDCQSVIEAKQRVYG